MYFGYPINSITTGRSSVHFFHEQQRGSLGWILTSWLRRRAEDNAELHAGLICNTRTTLERYRYYSGPSWCKAQPGSHTGVVAKLSRLQFSKEKNKKQIGSDRIYRYQSYIIFSLRIRSGSPMVKNYEFEYGYTRSRIWNENKTNCIHT
jgi:hypothetical protein